MTSVWIDGHEFLIPPPTAHRLPSPMTGRGARSAPPAAAAAAANESASLRLAGHLGTTA